MKKALGWMLACVLTLGGAATVAAQEVVIDWSTKKLIKFPPTVSAAKEVKGVIRNVNDVLYSYTVDPHSAPTPVDDARHFFGALYGYAPAAAITADNCNTWLETAKGAFKKIQEALSPIDSKTGKVGSTALADTIAAWNKAGPDRLTLEGERHRLGTCLESAVKAFLDQEYKQYESLRNKINGSKHEVHFTLKVYPRGEHVIPVSELFSSGALTNAPTNLTEAERTYKFTTEGDGELTLSAGLLVTKVEARSYESRTVPNQTQAQLDVNGAGDGRPAIAALLNYKVPRFDADKIGLALSAGPVLAVGQGKSETSNIGFFFGLSVHLWHRLYLTPGMHLGEFADFPRGFSASGDAIPANFGTLTPSKRWTTRFSFGITFRTVDFTKIMPPKKVDAETKNK